MQNNAVPYLVAVAFVGAFVVENKVEFPLLVHFLLLIILFYQADLLGNRN